MKRMRIVSALARGCRVLSLVLLSALGSTLLMRYAPGYFADSRELDAAHAGEVRAQLEQLQTRESSLPVLLKAQWKDWSHGDLGRSRHYDVPVAGLLRSRSGSTLRLLGDGVGLGWLLALVFAVPLSMGGRSRAALPVKLGTATLMAVPVGALATFSLMADKGGPVLVLAILVAVREFKLLHGMLLAAWRAPHLFHARAQGYSPAQALRVHLLPTLRPELLNLAGMSAIVALGALVPIEVVFDLPGLGQLAWAAAINRDLPVLVAMTALMAVSVGAVALLTAETRTGDTALCD